MLPSALALVAVAAVVLLLIGIFGAAGDDPVAHPPTTTDSPTTFPSPSVVPSAPSPTTASIDPSTASTTPTATPVLTPPPLPTEFPDIVTVVLNSTAEAGLAGRVSTYLGELGWTVGPVGNFEAPLDLSTVYYPEGYEDAARALAAATPSPSAVSPVVEGVAADSLTLVLGADAVDWLPATETGTSAEPTASATP